MSPGRPLARCASAIRHRENRGFRLPQRTPFFPNRRAPSGMQYLYSQQPGEVVEKLLYAVGFCGVVADVAGGEGQAYTIASVVLGLVALEFKNPKLFTTFFNFMVLSLLLDVIFLGVWKDRGGGAVAFAALALIGKVRRGCDEARPGLPIGPPLSPSPHSTFPASHLSRRLPLILCADWRRVVQQAVPPRPREQRRGAVGQQHWDPVRRRLVRGGGGCPHPEPPQGRGYVGQQRRLRRLLPAGVNVGAGQPLDERVWGGG